MKNTDKKNPKVFISYSWDNVTHEEWVLKLATQLYEKGIDVILDKWELKLGQLLPNFMEQSISKSQRVICVMTPNYKKKTEKLEGGVGYEYSIITAEILNKIDNTKFIPLLRTGEKEDAIPTALGGRLFIDMRNNEDVDELLKDIYNESKKPAGEKSKSSSVDKVKKSPFHIRLLIESAEIEVKCIYNILKHKLQILKYDKNQIYIEIDNIENVYSTFIDTFEHILYFDWKKNGITWPPNIKLLITDNCEKLPQIPNYPIRLTCFITKNLYGQFSQENKNSFSYLNDELFMFNQEDNYGHILRDANYYKRDIILRRFSFLWLILDQLPIGSWGHSVAGWMDAVGKDVDGFEFNKRIEIEGGFETTILNIDILTRLLSYDELFETVIWKKAYKYISERFDGTGFGPQESVGRAGTQIVSSIRHTALTTYLFSKLIASEECTTPIFNNFFVKGVEKLFLKETEKRGNKIIMAIDKRNIVLQYFLCWHIIEEIKKDGKVKIVIENNLDISSIVTKWEESKFHLEEELLSEYYKGNNKNNITTKLVIPYCSFTKMEVYTFLTSAFFLDPKMSQSVKLRYKKGIEFIKDNYINEFGNVSNRYSKDYLRSKIRGIKNAYSTEGCIDLGCTAMFLRVLRDDNILNALWNNERPNWLPKFIFYLNEDLLENFDRFIICPKSYDLTNAGMLANFLVGDDENVFKNILNTQLQYLDERIDDNGVVSVENISKCVEELQDKSNKAQVSNVSMRYLLLAKRTNRYISDKNWKCLELSEFPLSNKAKSILTSLAYNDCVSEFVNAHISEAREHTINDIVSKMEKLLGGLVGKNILDAGCGLGDYSVSFHNKGSNVTAIDISKEMIHNARNKNDKINFQVMDMLDIPNEWKNCFNGIVCITAFQHISIEVSITLIEKFYNILQTDGILRIDIQLEREQGFDPDLRYIESYNDVKDAIDKLNLEQIGFKVRDFREWKLEKGKNSFDRFTEFLFVELWIQKK